MKKFTFLTLALCGFFFANAQRQIDLEVSEIVSPGQVRSGVPALVHFVIKNNGLDPILVNDTIFFRVGLASLVFPAQGYYITMMNKDMNAGDTFNIMFVLPTLNVNDAFDDSTRVFAFVRNLDPQNPIELEDGAVALNNYNALYTRFGEYAGIMTPAVATITSSVYPNPASTEVNIAFASVENAAYTVNVFDINGRLISTINGTSLSNETVLNQNVANLNTGIYFYEVVQNGAVSKGKFTVSK